MYCFEDMAGLRINYQKSGVLVMGSDKGEAEKIAGMFNYRIVQLPLKYLVVMVHNKHMSASKLSYVSQKVEKRIPTWQSVGLSSRGKMILIELCLSSVPNYTIGIYLLQEEVRQKMDTARANFFWPNGSSWLQKKRQVGLGLLTLE
jgi:hypothetical protein